MSLNMSLIDKACYFVKCYSLFCIQFNYIIKYLQYKVSNSLSDYLVTMVNSACSS